MAADTRSTLRALLRRRLPEALERTEIADVLTSDRAALRAMGELLGDASLQLELLAGDGAAAGVWLRERIVALAEEGAGETAGETAEETAEAEEEAGAGACVRELASAWVDEYLAGRLPPSTETGLWLHLEGCAACRARYRSMCSGGQGRRDDARSEEARVERLLRGLPWSDVETPEGAAPEGAAPEGDAPGGGRPEGDEPEGDGASRRFWLTRRGRITVYCLAVALFLGANLLLLLAPRGSARRPVKDLSAAPALPPLPEQPLSIGLLRFQGDAPSGSVWVNVQGSVASGDRLLLTYSIGDGVGKERGRPRHLALLAVFDRAPPMWLRPAVVTPGQLTSPPVTVPAAAVRLPNEIRVPTRASRMVIFAVLTDRAVPLGLIHKLAVAASRSTGFFSSPPLLDIDRSLQVHLSLDVL